ncbi:hypothetical protein [uncultured Mobiluncus sp.]|uniref:hypothetical protein n=1 Tax=uncultured Mobiluncus sp. TaxID=293425 RepID=UPI00260F32DF|nr:hypothetical protein [uncultured Mobiluncus sp.]
MKTNLLTESAYLATHSGKIEVDERLTQPWDEFITDFIEARLDEMPERSVYGCDLASEITMPINMDGTYFIWTAKTETFIKNHWDEAGEFYDHYFQEFGEPPANVFTEPDKFHVQMMIDGVEECISKSSFIQDNWDDEFILTKENSGQIFRELVEWKAA